MRTMMQWIGVNALCGIAMWPGTVPGAGDTPDENALDKRSVLREAQVETLAAIVEDACHVWTLAFLPYSGKQRHGFRVSSGRQRLYPRHRC